jgi:hypothetical protein
MYLRPHQFRVFKELLDSLGKRLRSLEEIISRGGEAISGIRDEKKADQKIQEEISKQISLLSIPKEEREANNANQERRQRDNRRIQRWINRGTWFTGICTLLAFAAAAYYAFQARKQSVTMEKTYAEIQSQTKAAEKAACAARDAANTSAEALQANQDQFKKTFGVLQAQIDLQRGRLNYEDFPIGFFSSEEPNRKISMKICNRGGSYITDIRYQEKTYYGAVGVERHHPD